MPTFITCFGGRVFYLETLASQLPNIREGGGLASVLEHCMYCGMSLGRVGLDFRALLPPIFEACIVNLFTSSVQVPPPLPHAGTAGCHHFALMV